jgi:hypothetical protein
MEIIFIVHCQSRFDMLMVKAKNGSYITTYFGSKGLNVFVH